MILTTTEQIPGYEIEILDASQRVAELAEAREFLFRSVGAAEAMAKLRQAHEAAGDL